MPDLKCGSHEFKSCSDYLAGVVSRQTSVMHVKSQLVHLKYFFLLRHSSLHFESGTPENCNYIVSMLTTISLQH